MLLKSKIVEDDKMKTRFLEKVCEQGYGDMMAEVEYWLIFLAPDQKNLGTCVVALKREESELSGLIKEEWSEFFYVVKRMERTIKKAFNATMFNWGSLMNSSYLQNHPDPHLHWHFIPRYREPIEFNGRIFKDPCFGKSTINIRETLYLPSSERDEIIHHLLKFLKL